MKDAAHHLKHVQRKIIQSARKEGLPEESGATLFERNVKSRDKVIHRRKQQRRLKQAM